MLELAATCFKSDQLHVRWRYLKERFPKVKLVIRAAKASDLAVQASLQADDAPIAEVPLLSSIIHHFVTSRFLIPFCHPFHRPVQSFIVKLWVQICRLSRQAQTLYLQAEQVDQAAAVMQVFNILLNIHLTNISSSLYLSINQSNKACHNYFHMSESTHIPRPPSKRFF